MRRLVMMLLAPVVTMTGLAGPSAFGNWECAFSALELSRATGELDAASADDSTLRYLDLVEETLAHVGVE